jgi:hypothetical protein
MWVLEYNFLTLRYLIETKGTLILHLLKFTIHKNV